MPFAEGDALLVFAKVPRPGQVKTRLSALITDVEAAELYAAFLHDALRQVAVLSIPVHVFVAPEPGDPPSRDQGPFLPSTSVRTQRGAGLGERMENAFDDLFAEGAGRVVLIGTDIPTLPFACIEGAFAALEAPDVVTIGPVDDGGYYLLGLRRPVPDLFRGMTYSHARVLSETLQRAQQAGLKVHLLPSWYDVDDPKALRRLSRELRSTQHGGEATRQVMDSLRRRYRWL